MQFVDKILAVESGRGHLDALVRSLAAIGTRFRIAGTPEQADALLRSDIFDAAIVATEIGLGPEPMLVRLSSLPSTKLLLAVGPPGDWEMERRARSAGAQAYIPRPVTTKALSDALRTCGCAGAGPASHQSDKDGL